MLGFLKKSVDEKEIIEIKKKIKKNIYNPYAGDDEKYKNIHE